MAYDEVLVDRIRAVLDGQPDYREVAMFGGIGFMLAGHMCVGAMKGGDLMVRVAPPDEEAVLVDPNLRPMDFTGRPMKGWLLVSPPGFQRDRDLKALVARSSAYVRTLPPKKPKRM